MLATVLDRKTGVKIGEAPTMYDHWSADLAKVSDYYPYGMPMPNKYLEHDWSRMGYNGQAKDDEVYGKGMLNTALHWEYDTRIGPNGRWNTDPVKNPSVSPYATFEGNPIWKNDVLGDDPNTYEVDHKAGTTKLIDNRGGDQTDYIIDKNRPYSRTNPEMGVFPTTTTEMPVMHGRSGMYANNLSPIARGPGYKIQVGINDGPIQLVDDPFTTLIGPGLIKGGLKIIGEKIAAASAKEVPDAVRVFRTFGGKKAREFGGSWTTVDPRTVPNYRDVAGLPNVNTGEKMIQGMVNWKDVDHIRPALPFDGNRGGLPELIIRNASDKIIKPTVTTLENPL